MKKILVILLGSVLTICIVWITTFSWNNLRGISPAILKPSQDIAQVIEQRQTRPAQNYTSFPLILPPGFSISIFAKGLSAPRVLAWDPTGVLLVSIPSQGRVVALPDRNRDGVADETVTVKDDLNRPHGLAFRCKPNCQLYVAEENQVAMYNYDRENFKATNKKKIVDLPSGGNHWSRTIMFLPNEDKLLIAIGSSCNVCNERDDRRAKILVASADGSDLKIFASGLRNAVFMNYHPLSKKVWVTEMGRDWIGDESPPDEINILEEGKDYGWPICYGKNIHDTAFDKNTYIMNPCTEPFKVPSYIDIPAHSAPLGLAFVSNKDWPKEYQNNLLVAYHGSWNRTVPTGYKIVRFKLDENGRYVGVEDFLSGWLKDTGEALGRPVDILIHADGKLFISDDKAGVVYLVQYRGG